MTTESQPKVNVRRTKKQDEEALEAAKSEAFTPSGETVVEREEGTFRVREVNGVEIATRIA